MNSVRERIIQEVIRQIEAKAFDNVAFDRITRGEIPDDYRGEQGSILAVLEGRETIGSDANRAGQNSLELFLSFAVPLAPGEVAATVSNNVAAELVKALAGNHTLPEGGNGTPLACTFKAVAIEPNVLADGDECATGIVEYALIYRTNIRDPFLVH